MLVSRQGIDKTKPKFTASLKLNTIQMKID